MSEKTVSVVIPAYNHAKYISEALNSVLSQTYKTTQIIVVNDGSTDNTLDLLNEYKDRIHLINKLHTGILDTVNEGLKVATGDFISFLDADDRWIKNKTELQLKLLLDNPEVDIVFGNSIHFSMISENNIISEKVLNVVSGTTRCGGLFKKNVFEKVIYKTEQFNQHSFIDWYSRVKESGIKTLNHPEVVFERRIHDSNHGLLQKELQIQQYFNSIKAALKRKNAKENNQGNIS